MTVFCSGRRRRCRRESRRRNRRERRFRASMRDRLRRLREGRRRWGRCEISSGTCNESFPRVKPCLLPFFFLLLDPVLRLHEPVHLLRVSEGEALRERRMLSASITGELIGRRRRTRRRRERFMTMTAPVVVSRGPLTGTAVVLVVYRHATG